MGGFVSAWLVALGLNVWDHTTHTLNNSQTDQIKGGWTVGDSLPANLHSYAPPQPKRLILISGLFAMLALLAEIPDAKRLATLIAWGVDIAYFTKIAQAGSTSGSPNTYIAYVSGPWPPTVAPNNVIIPNGSQTAAVANAKPSANPTTPGNIGSTITRPLTA